MQSSPQSQSRRNQKQSPAYKGGAAAAPLQPRHVFPPGPAVKACVGGTGVRGIEQIVQRAHGQGIVPARFPAFLQQLRPRPVCVSLPGLQPEAGTRQGCRSKSDPAVEEHREQPRLCLLLQPVLQAVKVIDGHRQYLPCLFHPGPPLKNPRHSRQMYLS